MKDPSLVSNLFDNLAEEFRAFAKQDTYKLRRDKVITERGIGYLSCIFTPHDEAATKYDLYQLIWNALQIALQDSEKEFKKEATAIIKQQQSISKTTKTTKKTTTATKAKDAPPTKTIEEICQDLMDIVFKIVINFYGLHMESILLPCVRKNMDNFTRLFIGQVNSDHECFSSTVKTTAKTAPNDRDTFLTNLETLCRGDKMVSFIVTAMTLGLVKQFGDSFIKTINYASDNPYNLNGSTLHQSPTIKHFFSENFCCSLAVFVVLLNLGSHYI